MTRRRRRERTVPSLLAGAAVLALFLPATAAEPAELSQGDDPYYRQGQETLRRVLNQQRNTNRAKNLVLFVGDGLGFSTVTAARIFEGQQRGVDGESNVLSWEAFPYLAAAKTYASDAQVADSAPTAVAMTAGVKTKNDIIGLDHTATLGSCEDQKAKLVTTLWEMAESIGMSTGAVTTARLTHATPAAAYAHVAHRDWESDAEMPPEAIQAGCADIARQLVEMAHGDGLEVAMGGGRGHFLPDTAADPEDEGKKSRRKDGRDLTRAWLDRYPNSGAFVWNKEQFDRIDPRGVDHVLGLFETSHMEYEFDRPKDKGGEPSLAEMTEKALDVLAKNPEGFVLMVEGGRIDHASHASNAYRTLSDAVAMNEAVKAALRKVNLDDTLIVVTGDHSHTLTINGYPKRGNPILGVVVDVDGKVILADDGKPYTTLSFANGPGSKEPKAPPPVPPAAAAAPAGQPPAPGAGPPPSPSAPPPAASATAPEQASQAQPQASTPASAGTSGPAVPAAATASQETPVQTGAATGQPGAQPPAPPQPRPRPEITTEQTTDPDYVQQALVPLPSETHGGEDLGIYAIGPWAHLFQGTVEQNYVFHVLDFASKISERAMAAGGAQPPAKKARAD